MNTNFHHIYSKGEVTIFRKPDDYIFFINHLAITKYTYNIRILAFSIMSTHIHIIVETWNETSLQEFIDNLRKSYFIHFNRDYNLSIPQNFMEINYSDNREDFPGKKTCMVYVNTNPTHHQITNSPLAYDFSSARYTFWDCLHSEREKETYISAHITPDRLGARDRRRILGKSVCDPTALIDPKTGAISPLSIIDREKATEYWSRNVRNFILDMHLGAKDSEGKHLREDALVIQSEKSSDIEVCKIIDEYALQCGVKNFKELSAASLSTLIQYLKTILISEPQIKRCLWLD